MAHARLLSPGRWPAHGGKTYYSRRTSLVVADFEYRITESSPIGIDGGYLIDGFPSVALTNAITTESMIHTSRFKIAGIIDSKSFPAVSLIEDGIPNYPTRIFVNEELKVAIFSSFLTMPDSLYKATAEMMLKWAKAHNLSYVISSAPVNVPAATIVGVGNTKAARQKLAEAGVKILSQGVIPGIPGSLLNQGFSYGQNVIVLLFGAQKSRPDFKVSAELCSAMSKLVPGTACDIPALQEESKKAERTLRSAEKEFKKHRHMYR